MTPFRPLIILATLLFSPSILPCDYTNDPEMQSRKAKCVSASKQWNCQLNRCMTSQEAFDMRKQFQKCQELTDEGEKQECFLKLAEDETKLRRNDQGKGGGIWETMSVGLSASYALLGAIAWYSKSGGSCLSRKIMVGGSAAHLATHFLILRGSKKKFDSMAKRGQSSSDDFNAQLRAFHLLKENQEAIKKYASRKKLTYTIVAAAYGGALATAILEKTGSFKLTPCGSAKKEEKKDDDEEKDSFLSFLPKMPGPLNINTSTKVAIYSGIGMGLAFKLRQAAAAEEQKAESNIKHIEEIIARFEDSISTYCPQGREDLKNPRCYCYTSEGAPNPQRSKSNICQNLWKKDNVNYAVKAGNYSNPTGELSGCLNVNGQFDPDCQCRKYQHSTTGKNLCLKSSQNIVIPSPLQKNLSGAGEALKAADVLTGASNKANLNGTALRRAATQSRNYADKLVRQYNQVPSPKKPPLPITPKFVEHAVRKMSSAQMQKRFGPGPSATSALASIDRKTSPALSKAIQALKQKKRDSGTPNYQKKSSGTAGKVQPKSSSGFSWPTDSPSRSGGKTLHLPKSRSPYPKQKNAALHSNPQTSIWKLISNRYLISGVQALFDEKDRP